MDHVDAELAVATINHYWPRTLDDQQIISWGRVVSQQHADFDTTCLWIADRAARETTPPHLAELCGAIRPAPPAPILEDSGPPAPRNRGQAWAQHVAAIYRRAAGRLEEHDHHHGWENCPVCSQPGDHTRCGNPTCEICA